MNKYYFELKGRKTGALGITYLMHGKIVAENKKQATHIIYKHFEHLEFLTLTEKKLTVNKNSEYMGELL